MKMLDKVTTNRTPGRPKDSAKRSAILAAARAIFFERGLGGATIDAIASDAGVSRVTIYSHFENKERLLAAVVEEETQDFAALSKALEGRDTSQDDVRAALTAFGDKLLGFIEQPHTVRANRIMIGQAHDMPEAAKFFFEIGPLRMHRRLAHLISSADAAGALQTDDAARDAEFLIGMWRGLHHIELQFNASSPRSKERRKTHVRRAVDFYLSARATG